MPKLKTRSTTESAPSLDVRKLNRDGLLAKGTRSTVNAENAATATLLAGTDSIDIAYTLSGGKAQPLSVSQAVTLTTTSCNYGNDRTWFECPGCGSRVAVVYLGDRVACRTCSGLHYRCQSETPINRMVRRLNKINAELKSAYDRQPVGKFNTALNSELNPLIASIPERPGHMKKSKYTRLANEAEAIKQDKRMGPAIESAKFWAILNGQWRARLR